jgi:hypothetical protein
MYNKFGVACKNISLGASCESNVFGENCRYVSFRTSSATTSSTNLRAYSRYNVVDPGTQYITLYNSSTASSSTGICNVRLHRMHGTTTYTSVNITTLNSAYEYHVGHTMQTGNVYAAGLYETSDERFKDFGDKIVVDFNKLKGLKKNYFTWKHSDDGSRQIGVSAQEIQSIYPEIVSDNNGQLTVAYDKLSVVALAAIDLLCAKNDALSERLNRLERLLEIEN